jgi:ribosome-associated translation inhibitor RaiA
MMNMPIDFIVRGRRGHATGALRRHALRRLSFAIRRFEHRVRHVTVRFVDLNGPRRGVDSRCTVTVDVGERGPLFVEATAASPFGAITLASLRLSEALRRYAAYAPRRRASAPTARRHVDDLLIA